MSRLLGESFDIQTTDPLLYTLAEDLVCDSSRMQVYEHAKTELLGQPDPQLRYDGGYKPIARETSQGFRVYSHPVFSGFDARSRTVLHISYDHWRPLDDPTGWFVERQSLDSGTTYPMTTLQVKVDDEQDLFYMQVEHSASLKTWPPGRHPAYFRLPRDQTRIEAVINHGRIEQASLRFGMRPAPSSYQDIEILESMISVVRQLHGTHPPEHMREMRQYVHQRMGHIASEVVIGEPSKPWLVAS